MSLNYQLPDGMTNGSLQDEHPEIAPHLFTICVSTIETGVPEITGEWYDRMRQLLDVKSNRYFPFETKEWETEFWSKVLTILYGMTTNASRKTKTEWKEYLKTVTP